MNIDARLTKLEEQTGQGLPEVPSRLVVHLVKAPIYDDSGKRMEPEPDDFIEIIFGSNGNPNTQRQLTPEEVVELEKGAEQ
jgi:hypothetical protein